MQMIRWVILALALVQGAWLTFDGTRALIVGDYVTRSSPAGPGQLGPWSRVVAAVGIDPRSTLMKCVHVLLGLAWLISAVVFFTRPATGWWMMLFCGLASLWYLPIGTLLGLIIIVLLSLPSMRGLR